MARGDVTALGDWTPAQAIEALQKLCHDLLAVAVGAAPRYFAAADLPKPPPPLAALTRWSRRWLRRHARQTTLQCRTHAGSACRPGAKHPTLQTTNAFLTMSTPSNAPVPASCSWPSRKRALCMLRTFPFVEGGIFCPHPARLQAGRRRLCAADLARRYPALPGGGRVAWVPQRVRPVIAPRGGHPVSKRRKIPSAQAQDRRNLGNCPGLGASYPDHLMAPLRPVPTRAGWSAFYFDAACLLTRTAISRFPN